MKFGKRDKSIVDSLFLLVLLGVFLICALFIVLFGAKIYKNTVKSSEDSFFERTCCTYITEKIRQNDNSNGVSLLEEKGNDVLKLTKDINSNSFSTYLYCDDGYIKEYTRASDLPFDPSYGTNVIGASSFVVTKHSEHLLEFIVSNEEGVSTDFFVSIKSDIGGIGDE